MFRKQLAVAGHSQPLAWWLGRLASGSGLLLGGWLIYQSAVNIVALDNWSFWSAWRVGLYSRPWPESHTYVYPPALAQAIWPLTQLSWPVFHAVWTVILGVALLIAAGPAVGGWALALLPFALKDIREGQIHALFALAIVLGFRYPGAWSFVLLTKVTPGIGLLWFAVRREWRSLAVAAGATAVMGIASFLLAPDLWLQWFGTVGPALRAPNPYVDYSLPILVNVPFFVRLLVAAALVGWGARANHRWVVPVAVFLALPAVWVGGLTVLLVIPRLSPRVLSPGTA
ncbi:MAG: DUF2029 domain-containing protein [Chloroflexota bacterium]|nr:DUF2029 domain-containing protein [Chloroflexota bacterium]